MVNQNELHIAKHFTIYHLYLKVAEKKHKH